MRRMIWGLVAAIGLATTSQAAPIQADVVFIIDTSPSMGGDIGQVKMRIGQFNTALTNANIDANYALVRFGGNPSLIQNLTDFGTFSTPGSPFSNLTANGGASERGSQATLLALSSVTFRLGAVKNFILITDEDDDSLIADFNAARLGLTDDEVLFNAIGVPGVGNTNARYGVLTSENGGMLFNILSFRNNPEPFFDNFTTVKVREILDAVGEVPEPATLAVFGGIALAGALGYRRRKATATA